ncbi:hypothetical protein ILUMI_17835 [Ignelater luminosus]|uniref:Reverse transcriptase RNase H-like domain-containing protein n=1 Tax=Ignelater luminosus TaxID=2038154 RepID=A0A8K0CRH6_IGNLU|nr:hypothetical protein ILUMI_17835 [Ignelater luminosus]
MDSFALSPLQPLNLTGNVSHNFKLWLQRFQIYLKAHNLDMETEERQVNILLNYIGDKCITVFNSFNLTNAESKSVKTVIDKFTDHFAPKKHLTLLGHNCFARKQKSDEPFEDYFTAIINLGLQCDLRALREELTKAKIISGLDSKYDDLRTRLMAEEDKTLTLSYVTKYLKTAESSRQAVTQMQKDNRVDVSPMSEDVLLAKSKVNSGVLSYFDPKSHAVLSVDSSSQGLRAVILQNNKPNVYSSRALTESEQAYCSIECEMLGIVNGCIKLRQFLIGRRIEVHMDHHPLETLFKRPLNKVPPRLQRMMLALQGFDLHVVYKPGKELFIADALSRAFGDEKVEKEFYTLNEEIICQGNASADLKPKVYRLPEKFVRHQDTVKKYYDKRTRPLQSLREGQNIRFQKHQSGHRYAGKVKGKGPQPRSYQVRDHSGNLFTRNRVMINPSPRQSSPTPTTPPTNSTLEFPQPVQIHQQIGDSTLQETAKEKAVKNLDNKIKRSGRVVRNPKKLFDD